MDYVFGTLFFLRFYLHRIGRSGRFGRKGVAVNFVRRSTFSSSTVCRTEDEALISDLEKFYSISIKAFENSFTWNHILIMTTFIVL